ncbi:MULTISPECIES: MaoC/PaaZ C-terminal domain-containing protein [unclassified Pseudoclavibacter]|uniref:MaoC/PaaZ C-terminal domain-containing protein n=1 Tax=unclassified Pseudoclavibacter TaxID=2615177 RepID=UPI0012F19959|nr:MULTISPECIES: MaoC/PaaZ C-terminal domain-containing protein [unclassified Pseudoclavibacter]MBF4460204.1 MaoC family dehydratase N-terminal domain-containing protein [Pseudoclavibacter sp. VKM Ac-2867]VXC25555.1 Acyl dehydratase [Pseudoclavibacter sp. 8L]
MTDTISVAQLPRPDFTSLEAGTVIAERTVTLTRDTLVRYAGASGDFNPIHYRDDVAEAVGLPGVLAHGMLTMGVAVQPVVDALGDPGRVVDYQVRFTRPVVVDPQAGAEVSIVAKIGQLAGEDGVGRIDLVVSFGGQTVLAKSQVRADFRGEVPAVLPAEATA